MPDFIADDVHRPGRAPQWSDFAPPAPGVLSRVFGGEARFAARQAEAEQAFAQACDQYDAFEASRQTRIAQARREHEQALARAQQQADAANARLDTRIAGLSRRDREAVQSYLADVAAAVPRPADFPRKVDLIYSATEEHAAVEFELPGPAVVPTERTVTYVRSRDDFVIKDRPARECAALYRAIISQTALLAIRDLFVADQQLRRVNFDGRVQSTNPATGRPEYPCLISLMVEREEFDQLVLEQVSAEDCLRHLQARVANPYAVEPVAPFIDFDLTRYAFTAGQDVVSELDGRPDLMDLTPTQFEHLVRQLFEATPGMEGWTTQPSKDDGVDAVITNKTPITGGLTVVQAKQYTASIGVGHVRELLGAMEDKKAGRGVLVTTSRFTRGSYELSQRLGRIQLIDGANLVYLIKQNLQKDVVIGRRK